MKLKQPEEEERRSDGRDVRLSAGAIEMERKSTGKVTSQATGCHRRKTHGASESNATQQQHNECDVSWWRHNRNKPLAARLGSPSWCNAIHYMKWSLRHICGKLLSWCFADISPISTQANVVATTTTTSTSWPTELITPSIFNYYNSNKRSCA